MRRHHNRILTCLGLIWGMAATEVLGAEPASERPVVRVIYFIPTDRQPEPEFPARLDRIMKQVQEFYRDGMDQNGYGKKTFALDRDAKGALRIYEVRAKGPMRDYGRNGAGKVRREVKEAMAKQYNLNIDQETVIIFQLLLEWKDGKAEEIGPYVGGGGPRSGTAWVYDDAKLDTQLLTSREPGGYYHGPCSWGEFNTHYIGGVLHELGHAFGLPHDCEHAVDRPRRGRSLMGGGNHTYGRELRKAGPGAFLSAASALPLSVHPLFTGKCVPAATMTCEIQDLQVQYQNGKILCTGRFHGGPPVVGLVAYNDPKEPAGDYDAIGVTNAIAADGKFRFTCGELKPGDYELRLRAYGTSGDKRDFKFSYSVDRQGKPDLRSFPKTTSQKPAQAP